MTEIDKILKILKEYSTKNPSQRFGQILFNLNITQFKSQESPEQENYEIRDIYNDCNDTILNRIIARREKMNNKE